jgi:chorismate mutase/prephenate dehydratase
LADSSSSRSSRSSSHSSRPSSTEGSQPATRQHDLGELRTRIDAVDDRILQLLEERAGVMADVAQAKRDLQLPAYDPERERLILDRLAARAARFPADSIRAVYREVMRASLALQEPLKVAYLGPEGTFSHAAARAFFGLAATYCEATTFEGVFDAVARRQAHEGILPIENSTEGSVIHAVDALVANNLFIRAEFELEVSLCLLTRAAGFASIERVYSHPQPLGQCRMWLAKHLGSAQIVQSASTAAAVREALADPAGAAVGSPLASEIYSVPILRERIQDYAENFTRFVIVAREDAKRTGDDKTTVAFSIRDGHERGALLRVLTIFDEEGINLFRIESRPSREKAWDYVFLAELQGHREDAQVERAFHRLADKCPMFKPLGSYPRAHRT